MPTAFLRGHGGNFIPLDDNAAPSAEDIAAQKELLRPIIARADVIAEDHEKHYGPDVCQCNSTHPPQHCPDRTHKRGALGEKQVLTRIDPRCIIGC